MDDNYGITWAAIGILCMAVIIVILIIVIQNQMGGV